MILDKPNIQLTIHKKTETPITIHKKTETPKWDSHWVVELSVIRKDFKTSKIQEGTTLVDTLVELKEEVRKVAQDYKTTLEVLEVMDFQLENSKSIGNSLITDVRHRFENFQLLYDYLDHVNQQVHYNI